jgi:hypothetical protein
MCASHGCVRREPVGSGRCLGPEVDLPVCPTRGGRRFLVPEGPPGPERPCAIVWIKMFCVKNKFDFRGPPLSRWSDNGCLPTNSSSLFAAVDRDSVPSASTALTRLTWCTEPSTATPPRVPRSRPIEGAVIALRSLSGSGCGSGWASAPHPPAREPSRLSAVVQG